MKLSKINSNTIKIQLTITELSQENLNIEDIEKGKKKAKDFLFKIIENSTYAKDFLEYGSQMLVQIDIRLDSIIQITITKIPDIKASITSQNKIIKKQYGYKLYAFESLEVLVKFIIKTKQKKLYVGQNSLYKSKENYFLSFPTSSITNQNFSNTAILLLEYSNYKTSNSKIISHILENSQTISNKCAIQKISNYIFE